MSQLLATVPFFRAATGGIYVSDGVAPPNHWANGIPYEQSGAVALDEVGAINHYHQGLPFTAIGRISAKAGVPSRIGNGGAPFNADGSLSFEEATADHFQCGVGYSADNSLCVSFVK